MALFSTSKISNFPDIFWCLEISKSYLRVTPLSILADQISLAGDIIYRPIDDPIDWPLNDLADLFKELTIPRGSKIILIGHNHLVSTIPAWVIVRRSEEKRVIDEGELENITSQAVWKFLHTYKATALKQLEAEETEILLNNVRIMGVRINNHKVINPQGFKAKTLEFLVEETFVNRSYYRSLEELLPEDSEIVFSTSIGFPVAEVISRASGFTYPLNLLCFLPDQTLLLDLLGKVRYQNDISNPIVSVTASLAWEPSHLLDEFTSSLSLETEVSQRLYRLYLADNLSRSFKIFLGQALLLAWEKFLGLVAKYNKTSRRHQDIKFISESVLPDKIIAKGKTKIIAADLVSVISELGFKLDDSIISADFFPATALSALIEETFSRNDNELNQLARRRARWLTP